MIDYKELITERRTVSNGLSFRPTVFKILRELADEKNLSIAGKIEQLVLEDYEKNKREGK